MERRRKARMKKKMIAVMLTVCLSILFSGMTCMAAAKEDAETYAYREELLVSYKEYWYTDGAGIESHVVYGKQYKSYTFLNGYRELTPIITQLSTTAAGLPPNVSKHHQVQLQYEFY